MIILQPSSESGIGWGMHAPMPRTRSASATCRLISTTVPRGLAYPHVFGDWIRGCVCGLPAGARLPFRFSFQPAPVSARDGFPRANGRIRSVRHPALLDGSGPPESKIGGSRPLHIIKNAPPFSIPGRRAFPEARSYRIVKSAFDLLTGPQPKRGCAVRELSTFHSAGRRNSFCRRRNSDSSSWFLFLKLTSFYNMPQIRANFHGYPAANAGGRLSIPDCRSDCG